MSGPELITLGCRLNFAESEAMRAMASDRDDLVIVNSCAVTAEAVRKTRQQIRKARRARPDAEIVVTGCAVQTEPETFAEMPEVSRLLGNRDKMMPESFASDRSLVSDIMAVRETAPHLVTGFSDRARAFVEVQNGCDHRCTFCVIPYGRGNSRSVPAGLVVERIKALVDEGFQEVVLTGVDVTSYGPDLPGSPSLGLLVERILNGVPDLQRLRLSSLDSIEIDDRLFEIITSEPRFMPHLHLSLQAGDDMILKRMKRRHSRAQSVEMVARLKAARPEIAIGADIIAGFPTESDEMAANTLALVDDCQIVFGHIFPYSARRGTPAAKMPQVPVPARKARAERLREATARQKAAFLEQLVKTEQNVLIERKDGYGHGENFADVMISQASVTGEAIVGQTVRSRITGIENGKLVGEPV
ncbi:tRNA (N(6)-L-threonylcarbamoyladenosine(37)-C(2))-methylthiotransferase MtaB [Parasphingopyxis sp. CP4]|uniref:tRNA (N(6)-L-threonylcarbamoyladenosine(37)-C(2))- methylthiotransferase MtaB n=1 Tax=Parasphingopyxis sp. CP4 TaxID=2724527 RepID=UPI0015A4856F|nr:tRNA (N(6)-L-threonylcarbamoyladenosine(37)-C(2))-methylthiotransferase MtaB [Parasphingopyxis sp. CP4]QLC21595.1 tRNA (N(6)-L-threonylcarbamoyladenosine(37)-C(2))-methylthiotransferase MtaB [Parasphingopyxis sp. CP4]